MKLTLEPMYRKMTRLLSKLIRSPVSADHYDPSFAIVGACCADVSLSLLGDHAGLALKALI